jgi:hypothetical protein
MISRKKLYEKNETVCSYFQSNSSYTESQITIAMQCPSEKNPQGKLP